MRVIHACLRKAEVILKQWKKTFPFYIHRHILHFNLEMKDILENEVSKPKHFRLLLQPLSFITHFLEKSANTSKGSCEMIF